MGRNSGGGSRRTGGSSSGGGGGGRISGGRTSRVPGTGSAGRGSSSGRSASSGRGASSGPSYSPPPGPSYHNPPPPGPRPPRYGFWGRGAYPPPPPRYGGGPFYSRRPASGNCLSGCLMPFFVLFLIAALVGGCMTGWGRHKTSYNDPRQPAQYAQNHAEPVPPQSNTPSGQQNAGSVKEPPAEPLSSDYFTDALGWIKSTAALDPALKSFEEETGVKPYLYLTEDVNGNREPTDDEMDRFAGNLYDRLFTDENHFLLIFQEYGDFYMTWYVCGSEAAKIMDEDAANIVLDYVDKLYSSDMEDEEFFSSVFTMSAHEIMKDKS